MDWCGWSALSAPLAFTVVGTHLKMPPCSGIDLIPSGMQAPLMVQQGLPKVSYCDSAQ